MNIFYKRLLFGIPKSKYFWSDFIPIYRTGIAKNLNGRMYIENISLGAEDYAALVRHILNPPPPNEKMKALFREYEST